jgi:hypothetical protein
MSTRDTLIINGHFHIAEIKNSELYLRELSGQDSRGQGAESIVAEVQGSKIL